MLALPTLEWSQLQPTGSATNGRRNLHQAHHSRPLLQAQSLVRPLAITGAVSLLLAPMWYHLLMTVQGLGMDGSAYAFILSQVGS